MGIISAGGRTAKYGLYGGFDGFPECLSTQKGPIVGARRGHKKAGIHIPQCVDTAGILPDRRRNHAGLVGGIAVRVRPNGDCSIGSPVHLAVVLTTLG